MNKVENFELTAVFSRFKFVKNDLCPKYSPALLLLNIVKNSKIKKKNTLNSLRTIGFLERSEYILTVPLTMK